MISQLRSRSWRTVSCPMPLDAPVTIARRVGWPADGEVVITPLWSLRTRKEVRWHRVNSVSGPLCAPVTRGTLFRRSSTTWLPCSLSSSTSSPIFPSHNWESCHRLTSASNCSLISSRCSSWTRSATGRLRYAPTRQLRSALCYWRYSPRLRPIRTTALISLIGTQ